MRVFSASASVAGVADNSTSRIPAELIALKTWVCWHYETRDGQRTKPPINPHSNGKLRYARSNDPSTWADFDTAVATATRLQLEGIGLCLSADDSLTGLDLDHVIHAETGELDPLALEVLDRFAGTYTEISPSGTGLRIWCYGKPQRSGKCSGKTKWLEVYSYPSNRYLTVTGNHWPDSAAAVTEQQPALDWLHQLFMVSPPAPLPRNHNNKTDPVDLEDAALLSKAHHAKNGALFAALWSGDTSSYNNDESAADLALCNLLAFWTGNDSNRIDRLFRQSGLFRSKWDERHGERTYGDLTVAKAISGNRATYTGKQSTSKTTPNSASPSHVDESRTTSNIDVLREIPTVSPCTHLANAFRIQHYYKSQIWYVIGVGWLVWTGQFWKPDPTSDHSIATGFVNGLSKYIAAEAGQLADEASHETRKELRKMLLAQTAELIKWAAQSENAHNIASGLQLSKYALLRDYDALNSDPMLFNVVNGTLDLRTGKLRPHDPEDLITFVAPVVFDPVATCPTWQQFLLQVFADDQEMVAFIQRAIGWSLTGIVKERALFFLYGENGKNGKSTLVETIMKLVGICGESSYGYSRKVTADTFMKSKNHDDNQRKAATLAGPRFVCTSEVAEEHRLNEQLVKDITGGDTIEARKLYQEAFTFKPQFKTWMYGNHKPMITGTDDAIWSRVRMVPFEVSFAGREDLELPGKLEAELSGILNWAIRGCLDWQQHGLQPPAKVQAATQAYRDEMDVFGPFIAECCVIHRNAEVWSSELSAAYKEWCVVAGVKEESQHKFGRYLTSKGFFMEKSTGGRIKRIGIGLGC
ncbi:MAG: hypothetical protein IPL99_03725 [Candidatus Competibacteraceae bacterium]|nr:hypothetical protein [Candidatus Competibacteraceae bacterium]